MNTTTNRRIAAAAATLALGVGAALAGGPAVAADSAAETSNARVEARKPAKYKVTAKISASEAIAKETTIKIKGKVKGAVKYTGKVLLEQRLDASKKWKRSGYAKVKGNGSFTFTEKPSTPGVRHYRVVTQVPGTKVQSSSKEFSLDVWQWRNITWSKHFSTAEGVERADSVIVATEPDYGSLRTETAGTAGFAEFTLGKKCRTLRTAFAMDDKSVTGSTGSVRLTSDGVEKANQALAIGTPATVVDYDVTNAFRIRFDLTSTATPAGFPVVLDPQALCLY